MTALLNPETSVNQLIENFPSFIGEYYSKEKTPDFDSVIEIVNRVIREPYTVFDADPSQAEENRKKAIRQVMRRFIAGQLSSRFPRLSKDLFTLKRYVQVEFGSVKSKPVLLQEQIITPDPADRLIEKNKAVIWTEVPLVLKCSKHAEVVKLKEIVNPNDSKKFKDSWEIKSVFPGKFHSEYQQAAFEGYAIALEALAKLFRSVAAGFVSTDRYSRNEYTYPTVSGIWIPTFNNLWIEPKPPEPQDPALVLEYLDEYYLIGSWEVPQEEPLNAILSEFLG